MPPMRLAIFVCLILLAYGAQGSPDMDAETANAAQTPRVSLRTDRFFLGSRYGKRATVDMLPSVIGKLQEYDKNDVCCCHCCKSTRHNPIEVRDID